MERISEQFNQKYPNDVISVYVKTDCWVYLATTFL